MLRLRNNSGVALVIVFLVTAILLAYSTAFVGISIYQSTSTDRYRRRIEAFNLAESGLDHAIFWLRAQGAPLVGNRTDPWGGVQAPLTGGTYTVTITDLGTVGGSTNTRRYRVTSTGTFNNITRVLTNLVQVDNYARYIWFTDQETYNGTTVWFWTEDHLNGPTHTNSHFNIYRNPVFEGEVRSVDDYIRYYNNGSPVNKSELNNPPYDMPVFMEGVDFGVEPSTMPSQALNLRAAASSTNGLWLRGNSTVVLNSNGTMNVTNSRKGWTNHNMPLPANGALFVNGGNLTISGTLNGRLTVGASQDVIVPNSLTYADDPRVNPASDDVMGIISEQDVVIDDNAPTNMEIDACIMALETSFILEDYWSGPAKGTLTVHGGIIQDERGPVGTFNGSTGQKLSGYSKDYTYDSRLLTTPPPFIPTTGDYITLSWEEN